MSSMFTELSSPKSCRLIDLVDAEIRTAAVLNSQFLVVYGNKPYLNMKVELVPQVYIEQPEYWEIEVIGCLHGVGLPADTPYNASLSLSGLQGRKGIEIVGAITSKKIEFTDEALVM